MMTSQMAARLTSAARAPTPLYYRVREALRAQIESGELAPGSPVPTENQLIERYGVSRTTVREAVLGLVQEGLLYRKQGKGTFVAARRFQEQLGALTGFTEEMEARGLHAGARVLTVEAVTLQGHDATLLGLPIGAPAYRIARLRLANEEPVEIETAFFPHDIGFRLAQDDLHDVGIYALLEQRYGVQLHEAEQTIEARAARADEARLLGVRRGAPVLVIERVTSDVTGRLIELGRSVYRADRYKYRVRLRRHSRAGTGSRT
jgi:GntR family transcriptional regulator